MKPDLDEQLRSYVDALVARADAEVGKVVVAPELVSLAHSRRRPAVLAAVACAAALVAVVIGIREGRPRASVATQPSWDQAVGGGWSRLPDAPIDGRSGHASVWTGTEMIVAGGVRTLPGSGRDGGIAVRGPSSSLVEFHQTRDAAAAAFEPRERQWRKLPDMPSTPWALYASVWTGEEALFVGTRETGRRVDGIVVEPTLYAYSPVANQWRSEPIPTEVALSDGVAAVWTGAELLLWGYAKNAFDSEPLSLRYDPDQHAWRAMARGPLSYREMPGAAWTGSELIVFGGGGDDGRPVDTRPGGGSGAAYDPGRDAWRELPSSPLPEVKDPVVVWTGDALIVWGGNTGPSNPRSGALYLPRTDEWRRIADAPIVGRNEAVAAWTGSALLVAEGSSSYADSGEAPDHLGIYRPASDTWERVPQPAPVACGSAGVWTGGELLLWGGEIGGCGTIDGSRRGGWIFTPR